MRPHPSLPALLAVLALGCSRSSDAPKGKPTADKVDSGAEHREDTHADEKAHEEMPKRVRLSPRAITDAKVETKPVARGVLVNVLELPGELTTDPNRTARVSSPVGGKIESVGFQEGSLVKRGQSLVSVRVPNFATTKADSAAAQARAQAARANAERLQELAKRGFAATQEALTAKAEADALDAQARAAGELLRAMGSAGDTVTSQLSVRAPLGGVAIQRDAIVGQAITPDTMLATIADLSEVWFMGRVFEKDLGRLQIGARTEVRLNAFPNERFDGTLEYISQQVDPVARTFNARIRVTNRGDLLRIGLFGAARVAIRDADAGQREASLVVPRNAVTDIGGKTVVFVRQPDDDFEVHDVVLGASALGDVEVVSGLREGEQVVTEGVFTLKSAVMRSAFAEEE